MDTYYPTVEPGSLAPVEAIFNGLSRDPLWLDRKGCSYDPATKAEIQALWVLAQGDRALAAKKPRDPTEPVEPLSDADLEADLNRLHQGLKNAQPEEMDNSYYRVAVSLVDKIVSLRERLTGVRAVSEFRSKVFKAFEEVLTPEQRTLAIAILEGKGNNG